MQERIAFANALRGIAALSVLLGHYMGVYWLYRPGVEKLIAGPELPAGVAPSYFVDLQLSILPLNWGALGVSLFFLVSGFVIPFSFQGQTRLAFCIGRVFRIYPTYVAGFAVTIVAIMANARYSGQPIPFSKPEVVIHAVPGLRDLLASPAIDGVVWTLEVELKFYVIAVIISSWLRAGSMLTFAVPLALGLWLALLPAPTSAAALAIRTASPYLIFMFAGVALNFLHRRLLNELKAALVLSLVLWATYRLPDINAVFPSYAAALAIFLVVMAAPRLLPNRGPILFLANVSYPLYVCHGIAGYVVMAQLETHGFSPLAVVGLATAFALSVAWLLHCLVETPSQWAGRILARKVGSLWPAREPLSPTRATGPAALCPASGPKT